MRKTDMAVYRCPKCKGIVSKNAMVCRTCGFVFDLEHEPVQDEDHGSSQKLSKKEKRIMIIIVVAFVLILVIGILVAVGNARLFEEGMERWISRPKRIVTEWPRWD